MSLPITLRPTPIERPAELATPSSSPLSTPNAPSTDFGAALSGALSKAGAAERSADDAAQRFANGDPSMGIHEVMIAAEKASITVRYAITLKNRVLEAYRDLMNTPL